MEALSPISRSQHSDCPDAVWAIPWPWEKYHFLNCPDSVFYEIEAAQQSWTLRDLKRQFNAGLTFHPDVHLLDSENSGFAWGAWK
jgi:hypothetical protein